MHHLRPLAGAVLLILAFAAPTLAGNVEIITPGGNAGIAPPSGDRGDTGTGGNETRPPAAETSNSDSSGDDSPAEVFVQPGLQTRHFGAQANLTCKVASGAHDLVVSNNSPDALPPGTKIKWQLTNEGKRGYFAITGELGGGSSLVADNVLDGKATQNDTCVARVI